jgi:hypothetical protein
MIFVSDSLSQNAPIDPGTSPRDAALFDRSTQAQTIWFCILNWLVDTGKRNGVWKASSRGALPCIERYPPYN